MVLRFLRRLFGISSSSISKVRSTDARFSFEPDRGGAFTACWRASWEDQWVFVGSVEVPRAQRVCASSL